jgi:hypothetical protein
MIPTFPKRLEPGQIAKIPPLPATPRRSKEQGNVRTAQVGFPGWKNQPGQGAMSTIRKETKLTAEHGFD